MNSSLGLPTWTWADWRKAPTGTRFRSNQTGRYGTFIKPSRVRNNGAIVIWDAYDRWPAQKSNVVAPARDLTPVRFKAWDLVGFDGGPPHDDQVAACGGRGGLSVKIVGGRTLYEAVIFYDATPGTRVKLSRLATDGGLRQVDRWVDPDQLLEIVAAL